MLTKNSRASSRGSSSSKICKYKRNIEDNDYNSEDVPEIIEKDPLFESSTHKKNSNIAENTEGGNEDSTSKLQTHQPSSITHEDVPKRIMSNEKEEGDLKHDLDVLTSNTTMRNTDVDNDEQDFDFTTKYKTYYSVLGSQKIILKTNKKAKSNVNDDDDGGNDELHLESQTHQLLSVIYKDVPKRIMKKKVNDKEEEKDDNAE
ncbi:hypothetical protein RclHR1_05960011 [Rhizophagus clarus]|uniref:Uncharacterized protein n=1 Tax=Rhizophagus clarus TaxID=94130 RepID=A0A2Z6RVQ6_9GLOM|nr:hypothetical protein RclHR1_05960011 [Rhizophagus clarus]